MEKSHESHASQQHHESQKHEHHEHHEDMKHEHDHQDHSMHEHDHMDHGGHGQHDHHAHHAHMIQDFKKRFWISIILTIPIMVLAPMIQELFGYEFGFAGDKYWQFILSSIVFFYGGWPFLKGFVEEGKKKAPGMMTLIALAISVAYFYSSAVIFGLSGKIFFWELVGLIDIMLLGHWIEMKSVMGASNALQELAKMMPSEAHLISDGGEMKDVNVSELKNGNIILIKPGEKIPADGEVIEGESNVNEAMLTGESKPVTKRKGDEVIGGSINDNGSLKVKVTHTGD